MLSSIRAQPPLTVIDITGGQTRGKIVKTAPGNAEKLAP
jgi:hypothetical protein